MNRPHTIKLIRLILLNLSLLFFGTLLAVRDTRLINESLNLNEDNHQNISRIFCMDFPSCYRIVSPLTQEYYVTIVSFFVDLLSINPDPFSSNPVDISERLLFVQFISNSIFRATIIVSILFLLIHIYRSVTLGLFFLNGILIILIAPHAKLLSFVADFLPGTESQKIWFSGMPVIYLIDYDYLALLAILVFISFSDKFMSLKKFKLLSLGLLTFLIFEFLPLFLLFFFYFLRPQKIKRYMIPLLFPGFFMIFVTHFFSRNKEYRTLIETYMFYGQSNLSNPLGLLVISIIVLAPAVFIGMLFRILLIKFGTQRNITSKKNYQKTYTAAIKSLILIHTISLFTSGVTSEFGRQSLGIQVCLFLFIVNLVGHKQKSQT